MYYSKKMSLSRPTNMSADRIEQHDKALRSRLTDCDYSLRDSLTDGIIGDCYRSVNPLPLSTPISLCGIEVNVAVLIEMSNPVLFTSRQPSLESDDKSLRSMIDIETVDIFMERRNVNQSPSINRLMNQLLAIILKFWCGVIRKENCCPSCDEEISCGAATLLFVLFEQSQKFSLILLHIRDSFFVLRSRLYHFTIFRLLIQHEEIRRLWLNFEC